MLVHCPACQARYNVPEKAIGPKGRQLRCAKCSHEWRITKPEADAAAGAPVQQPEPAPRLTPSAVTPAPETAVETPSQASATPASEAASSEAEAAPVVTTSESAVEAATPPVATIARVRRTPAFLRRSSGRATGDRSISVVLVLLALLVPCFLGFLFWPYLAHHIFGSSKETAAKSAEIESTLSSLPPQPAGLQLANISHDLERMAVTPLPVPSAAATSSTSPTNPAPLAQSASLIVSGLVRNTTSQTIILPELRVQLFNVRGQELDNWPATFVDGTLQPGQTTRWRASFPAPAFRQLQGYRAFFTNSGNHAQRSTE